MKHYNCLICGGDWAFYAGDYNNKKELYPKICPLCNIPIKEMINEVYEEEGLKEVIRMIFCRIKNFKKI
jgi:hypothetical protein